MDAWLKWLIAKSLSVMPGNLDKPLYKLATTLLKIKIFQPLMTFIVEKELNSKVLKIREYKRLKQILDNSVYLKLDLEYNIDYSMEDFDEIKKRNFDKKLLKIMYNKEEKEKIQLVKVGDSYCASDVISYMRKNSKVKIKRDLPYLYGYFKWLDKENNLNQN